MDNQIIWQKWVDPFGGDDLDFDDELNEKLYDNFDNEESPDDDTLNMSKKDMSKMSRVRVMATPMGIIPVNENTCSSKIFNFWMGHTNFNITKYIAKIIEETKGVETLDIFTRYRFRIAVGKAFDDSSVMRSINENVYTYLE